MGIVFPKWNILNESSADIEDILLDNREITDKEGFFEPSLDKLCDPFLFADMEKVLIRFALAKEKQEKIVIYGDYDVDGITSAILLRDILVDFGIAEVDVYIPHRVNDGYGLSDKYFDKFKEDGVSLVVTVDNGISAVNEVNKIKKMGIDIIVTDHHEPHDCVPNCLIINPMVKGSKYPDLSICGVGVCFKILQAFSIKYPEVFNQEYLISKLDLVVLGTVADMGCMLGENRILVTNGLKALGNTKRPVLKHLMKFSDIDLSAISVQDIGFKIAPKINAAGRMESALLSFEALSCMDYNKALDYVFALQDLNSKRQDSIKSMSAKYSKKVDNSLNYILVRDDEFNPGLIGLLSASLSREYSRPCFVLCKNGDDYVGSARIPDIDLNLVKIIGKMSKYLKYYGGHKGAAGFTVLSGKIEQFEGALEDYFSTEVDLNDMEGSLKIDTYLDAENINMNLLKRNMKLGPFGEGNKEPIFLVRGLMIDRINKVGKDKTHLQITLKKGSVTLRAIAFNFSKHCNFLEKHKAEQKTFDCAVELKINRWNGNEFLDLCIIDVDVKDNL